MKKKPVRILVIFLLSIPVLGFGIAYHFYDSIPRIPETPIAPVVGLPENFKQSDRYIPAYSGPHPMYRARPKDYFQYPIRIGETGPVNSLNTLENKYPFLCGNDHSRNEQPLVDNEDGIGVPVFHKLNNGELSKEIIGYSKDCSYPTHVKYYYNRIGTRNFYPLEEANNDVAQIEVQGKTTDFIVRLETGTINRFIYSIVALKGENEKPDSPSPRFWNKRLIYQFLGGVGIGKRQGDFQASKLLKRRYEQLKKGYAIAFSTANQASNHYNIWLSEETALRVKRQFIARYGHPLYTVGLGASGGAVQQYLISQNGSDLLDAIIPIYSYPDMVSQIVYVMDCEPLEYFFDVTDKNSGLWDSWANRSWIQGLNADDEMENKFELLRSVADFFKGKINRVEKGSSGCVTAWRGLTPLVNNPRFTHLSNSYLNGIAEKQQWTHWDDLKYFYGVNEHGYANSTWDNVGVQYGLEALREGLLTPEKFLFINANIGGWKPPQDMEPEKFWFLAGSFQPVDLSLWGHHNMLLSKDGGKTPAIRNSGNLDAIQGAYRSGHVFIGKTDIPILDLRHYLDHKLDKHHATASFAARQRLINGQGHAKNQLIWISAKQYNPTSEALALMDRWMLNILSNPSSPAYANKPEDALDACFGPEGDIIAQGAGVWDGKWNNKPQGECMAIYPRFKTSREVAGDTVGGQIFKCHTQSISEAIRKGVYGDINMLPHYETLQRIFPQGVCDYTQADAGMPQDLFIPPQSLQLETNTGIY